MHTQKVLFITPLFSPFQIEVAERVNANPDMDYRIAFGMRVREARGQPHWEKYDYDRARYRTLPEERDDAGAWYAEEIRRLQPDILISGQIVGDLYRAVIETWSEQPYKLGFWMEPPDFTRP